MQPRLPTRADMQPTRADKGRHAADRRLTRADKADKGRQKAASRKGDIEGVDRTRFLSTPFMCLIIN